MATLEKQFLELPLSIGFEYNTSFCTILYENNMESWDHMQNLSVCFHECVACYTKWYVKQ